MRFISFTKCDELNSEAIFSYIMTRLRDIDVDISNCVSQCYDRASVMSGCNTGVRKRVTDVNPKAIYIHCHAHQLNLALVDSCKSLGHASKFFALLQSLYNYISSSIPHAMFMNKQHELGLNVVQLKKLSDTRWSCRYISIKAVFSRNAVLDRENINEFTYDFRRCTTFQLSTHWMITARASPILKVP